MGNIGKQKKHQHAQMQYKVSKIANYLDGIVVNTNEDIAYYNGMEHALSILEDRQVSYKEYYKLTFRQKIQQLFTPIYKELK